MAKKVSKPIEEARGGSAEAAEIWQCVFCGRQVDQNAESCPHCGYDHRRATFEIHKNSPLEETVERPVRAMLFLLSVLLPIAGFLIGGYFMSNPSPHVYRVGRTCVILSIAPTLILLGLMLMISVLR